MGRVQVPVMAGFWDGGLVRRRDFWGLEGDERSILGTGTPMPRVEVMVVMVMVMAFVRNQ